MEYTILYEMFDQRGYTYDYNINDKIVVYKKQNDEKVLVFLKILEKFILLIALIASILNVI